MYCDMVTQDQHFPHENMLRIIWTSTSKVGYLATTPRFAVLFVGICDVKHKLCFQQIASACNVYMCRCAVSGTLGCLQETFKAERGMVSK